MRRTLSLLLACIALALAPVARAGDNSKTSHEHLIHLPGIAGARALDRYFLAGVRDGGYSGAIEVIDWPGAEPGLKALLDRQRNEREAAKVAKRIEQLLKDDPKLKIRLVGHSGGSGIAVWALERLPEGVQVESVVFVAPALSQRYDLSKALRRVRGKAYAFISPNDAIVLGAGTSLLGTIDGVKEEASGLRGFIKPGGADDAQYAKLVPMDYIPGWMQFGNIGDHIGPMHETFAEKVISRILQDRPPEQPATRPAPATTAPATASGAPKQARASRPAPADKP
jgi:pimeloyl-ACP methyl ester carboxylesterase